MWRSAAGSVSRSRIAVAASTAAPIAASTTKIPRQDITRSAWPPTSGAKTGAVPITSISSEKTFAASSPLYRSRTIARAITMPTAPAMPWKSRRTISVQIVGARAHGHRRRDVGDEARRAAARGARGGR